MKPRPIMTMSLLARGAMKPRPIMTGVVTEEWTRHLGMFLDDLTFDHRDLEPVTLNLDLGSTSA